MNDGSHPSVTLGGPSFEGKILKCSYNYVGGFSPIFFSLYKLKYHTGNPLHWFPLFKDKLNLNLKLRILNLDSVLTMVHMFKWAHNLTFCLFCEYFFIYGQKGHNM